MYLSIYLSIYPNKNKKINSVDVELTEVTS